MCHDTICDSVITIADFTWLVRLFQLSLSMSSTKRKFCEHCQDYVSARTYRQHYDLYYDKGRGRWYRQESSDEESGNLSASEDNCHETASEGYLNQHEAPVVTESFAEASVSEPGIFFLAAGMLCDFSWVKINCGKHITQGSPFIPKESNNNFFFIANNTYIRTCLHAKVHATLFQIHRAFYAPIEGVL